MFGKLSSHNSSQPKLDVAPLRELVEKLDEQQEELLSAGSTSVSNTGQLSAPGGQITLAAIALPSFLNQANKARPAQ